MKFRSSYLSLAVAPLLLTTLSGCPGSLPDETGTGGNSGTGGTAAPCVPAGLTTTPPATFATVRDMFNMGEGAVQSCISAPCHGNNGQAPPDKPLSLQAGPDLYRTMTTYVSHACGDIPLIVKGKPNDSALIKIMQDGACGPTSFRMPLSCVDDQCMPPEYMTAISAWIANCAPEN
jgi:hypothetical protein